MISLDTGFVLALVSKRDENHQRVGPASLSPSHTAWLANYKLSSAGELRVYHDVDEEARVVRIRGVGKERWDRVLLGGKEIDLG